MMKKETENVARIQSNTSERENSYRKKAHEPSVWRQRRRQKIRTTRNYYVRKYYNFDNLFYLFIHKKDYNRALIASSVHQTTECTTERPNTSRTKKSHRILLRCVKYVCTCSHRPSKLSNFNFGCHWNLKWCKRCTNVSNDIDPQRMSLIHSIRRLAILATFLLEIVTKKAENGIISILSSNWISIVSKTVFKIEFNRCREPLPLVSYLLLYLLNVFARDNFMGERKKKSTYVSVFPVAHEVSVDFRCCDDGDVDSSSQDANGSSYYWLTSSVRLWRTKH